MRDPAHALVDVSVECERMGPPAMTSLLSVLTSGFYPNWGRYT
jgi:hypothetical protein